MTGFKLISNQSLFDHKKFKSLHTKANTKKTLYLAGPKKHSHCTYHIQIVVTPLYETKRV